MPKDVVKRFSSHIFDVRPPDKLLAVVRIVLIVPRVWWARSAVGIIFCLSRRTGRPLRTWETSLRSCSTAGC